MSIPSSESFRPRCGLCHTPYHHEPVPGSHTIGTTRPACSCPNPLYPGDPDDPPR